MESDRPTAASVQAALAAKPGATAVPVPSAPGVVMYKVMGKIFAILEIRRIEAVILKCDPHLAQMLREQYAGIGHRSHLDRRFWISVDLAADVPQEEVERLAAHSYELVCGTLTRKQKAELAALEG
jgi:predicted DNA-binding protein (MmcQ/YjbR family)